MTTPLTREQLSSEVGFTTMRFADGTEAFDGIKYKDICLPTFEGDCVRRLDGIYEGFRSQPGDVLIYGYMKSGSHWLWEIISLLQQRSSTPSETENKYQTFLETSSHEILEGLKQPRLMSTHLMHKELPAEMMKCQVIVPIRHPKDVAVSLYHHLSSEKRGTNLRCGWDRFIDELWFSDQLMFYYPWTEYMADTWRLCRDQENFHAVVYEQLLENPKDIIADLARFLRLDGVTDELLNGIVQATTFDNMKRVKVKSEEVLQSTFPAGYTMFRKGIKGDWRNHFTKEQSEKFDERIREQCRLNEDLRQVMLLYDI